MCNFNSQFIASMASINSGLFSTTKTPSPNLGISIPLFKVIIVPFLLPSILIIL